MQDVKKKHSAEKNRDINGWR